MTSHDKKRGLQPNVGRDPIWKEHNMDILYKRNSSLSEECKMPFPENIVRDKDSPNYGFVNKITEMKSLLLPGESVTSVPLENKKDLDLFNAILQLITHSVSESSELKKLCSFQFKDANTQDSLLSSDATASVPIPEQPNSPLFKSTTASLLIRCADLLREAEDHFKKENELTNLVSAVLALKSNSQFRNNVQVPNSFNSEVVTNHHVSSYNTQKKQFDCRPFQGPKTPPSPRVLREVCTTSDPRNLSPISPVSPEARSYSVGSGNRFVPYYYYQHRRYKKTGDTEQKFQGDKRESYQSQSRDGICLPNFAKSSCPGKYMTNYAVDHSGIHTYYQFKNTAAVPVKSSSHSAYSPLNQRRRLDNNEKCIEVGLNHNRQREEVKNVNPRSRVYYENYISKTKRRSYYLNSSFDKSNKQSHNLLRDSRNVCQKHLSLYSYYPRNCRYTDFSESRSSRNISNADVSSSRNLPEYINRNEQPRMRYNIPKTNEHSQRSQSSSSCSLADYELSYKPEDYGNIKRYQRTSNESYRRCGNSTFKCPYPRISEEKTAIKQGRSSGFRDGISREINNTLARRIRQRTESESSASTYHQDSDRQSRTCSSKASTSRSSSSSAGSSFSGSSSSVASGDKSSSGSSTRSSSLRLRSKSIKEASTRSSSYRSTEILSKPSKDKATPKITKEEEQEECDNGRTIFNEFKNISRDISSNSQTSLVLSKFVQIEEISVKRSPSNMDTDEDEKIVEKDSAGTAKLSHDFNKNVQYNEGEEGEILSESESELLSDAVPKSVGGQTEVRLPTIWEVEGKQAECHQEDSSSEITFTASSQYSPKEREKWTENSSISKEGKRRSGWLPSQIASEFIKKPCVTSFDSRLASFKRSSPVLRCKVGHQKTNSLKSSRSNLSLNYKDEGVIRARPTNRRLYNGKPWLHFCPATHTRSADSPCQKRARIGKFNDAATCIRNRALQFRTIGTRQIHDRAKDARFVLARRVKDIQSRNNFLRLNRHGYNRRAYRRS